MNHSDVIRYNKTAALLLALLLLSQHGYSQYRKQKLVQQYDIPKILSKPYVLFSIGPILSFHPPTVGDLAVTFPFKHTDQGPTSLFKGVNQRPFPSSEIFWKGSFEYGARNWFINTNLGMSLKSNEYLDVALGRRLTPDGLLNKLLFLKGQIGIGEFFEQRTLGRIDNEGKDVYALGNHFGQTFWLHHSKGLSTEEPSKFVRVRYSHVNFSIIPKLTVQFHPVSTLYFIEAGIGYAIPIQDRAYIMLTQANNNKSSSHHSAVKLDNPELSTTINNQEFVTPPYSFKGLQLELKIGIFIKYRTQYLARRR